MPRCTHKGCGQEFDVAQNAADSCAYHSGGPVFHEGLKSWSCCSNVNKPVLDFDEFMKIPVRCAFCDNMICGLDWYSAQGCTQGFHSAEPVKVDPPKQSTAKEPKTTSSEGQKEVYSSATIPSAPAAVAPAAVTEPEPPVEEEEDDLDAAVSVGMKCRRNGCTTTFESIELNRSPDGKGSVCLYHPMPVSLSLLYQHTVTETNISHSRSSEKEARWDEISV